MVSEAPKIITEQAERVSPGTLKKFYDEHWVRGKNLTIDEKCRKNFVVSNAEKAKSKFGRFLKILDSGCGRGWLTQILSGYGETLGVDLSVKTARTLYPNTRFKEVDVVSDKIEGTYEIIVSSEVVEHLPLEHQKTYFEKTSELLSENGYLILTTPNKPTVEKSLRTINQLQLQPVENWLDKESLLSLLSAYFEIEFAGTVVFCPSIFRRYRLFSYVYSAFYDILGGYKFVDKILGSTNYGLYLAVVARAKNTKSI